jgi:hypothetical protein
MAYNANLYYSIYGAKINPTKKDEFLEKVEKECNLGFSPKNCQINIHVKGEISFKIDEYNYKWYDEEKFEEILADYLEDGSVYFEFVGEDDERWGVEVFPKIILESNAEQTTWQERPAEEIIKIVKNSKAPQKEVINE